MTRGVRRLALFLATLAIALQALWPLLAQAKPRSAIQVPVCTVEGVTHYIELPAGETPLEQRSSTNHEHCGFCTLAGDRVAPAQLAGLLVFTEYKAARPPALRAVPAERPNHSSAKPRAPPFAS